MPAEHPDRLLRHGGALNTILFEAFFFHSCFFLGRRVATDATLLTREEDDEKVRLRQ